MGVFRYHAHGCILGTMHARLASCLALAKWHVCRRDGSSWLVSGSQFPTLPLREEAVENFDGQALTPQGGAIDDLSDSTQSVPPCPGNQ